MRAERGAQFDPDALEALLTAIPEVLAIRDRFRDEHSQPAARLALARSATPRLAGAVGSILSMPLARSMRRRLGESRPASWRRVSLPGPG